MKVSMISLKDVSLGIQKGDLLGVTVALTHVAAQHSFKILTIQQGEALGVSSVGNPWQASNRSLMAEIST